MHIIPRFLFAAALLALIPACASNSGSGGSGQNYSGRSRGPQSGPQATPYADPLFDTPDDAAKSEYVLANLKEKQRVYWYNAQQDKIYFLSIKLSPPPEQGRPKELEIVAKKPDGRVVLLKAKARTEGDKWKVFSAFVAPLDENGQKLLEADYKEAYRRATTPPEKPAAKQTAKQSAKQAQPAAPPAPAGSWTLPEDAPAGLVAASDFDIPVVNDARPQKSSDAPAGGKRGRRGGGGGMGGMGGGAGGGGVMGGPGGMGGM